TNQQTLLVLRPRKRHQSFRRCLANFGGPRVASRCSGSVRRVRLCNSACSDLWQRGSHAGWSRRSCGANKKEAGAESRQGDVTLKAQAMLEKYFPQMVSITLNRYFVGESPTSLRKIRLKCVCDRKPTSQAILLTRTFLLFSKILALSMRARLTYCTNVRPVACLNCLQKWNVLTSRNRAISSSLIGQ